MKHPFYFFALFLVFMFSSTGCSVSSGTVSNTISQVETSIGQSAAYQTAKATVDKWAAKIGLTPQQTQQIIPMVQDYYTAVATAVENTPGSVSQKSAAAKNALVAKLKTVLTTAQITNAISQL